MPDKGVAQIFTQAVRSETITTQFMFVTYAQNFEDVMLWRALAHVDRGFYIDIGAQDPVVDSVSFAFYERGWRGLHVEPTPTYIESLRRARPDEIVVPAAIGAGRDFCTIYEVPNTGLSTANAEYARMHENAGFPTRRLEVPCMTLAALFDRWVDRDVHWLKIDVEGMEGSVLESWSPSPVRPWIVLLEATVPRTQTPNYEEWEPEILALGYEFTYFDGLNRFYISQDHLELKKAFVVPPNVFDGFTLPGTACNQFSDYLKASAANEIDKSERRALELSKIRAREFQAAEERQARARTEIRELEDDLRVLRVDMGVRQSVHWERINTLETSANELSERTRDLSGQLAAATVLLTRTQSALENETTENSRLQKALLQQSANWQDRLNIQEHQARERTTKLEGELRAEVELANKRLRQAQERAAVETKELRLSYENQLVITSGLHKIRQESLESRVRKQSLQLLTQINASHDEALAMAANHAQKVEQLIQNHHNAESIFKKTLVSEQQKKKILCDSLEIRSHQLTFMREHWTATLFRLFAGKNTGDLRLEVAARTLAALEGDDQSIREQVSLQELGSQQETFMPVKSGRNVESLTQLLTLFDEEFVRAAYLFVLGRPADSNGLGNYLEQIRRGESKSTLIAELALSTEGAKRNVDIPELRKFVAQHKRRREPILSFILKLLGAPTNHKLAKRSRSAENQILVHTAAMATRTCDFVETKLSPLQLEFTAMPAAMHEIRSSIDEVKRDLARQREEIVRLQALIISRAVSRDEDSPSDFNVDAILRARQLVESQKEGP